LLSLLAELVDTPSKRPGKGSIPPAGLRTRAQTIAAGAMAASRLALARPDPETALRGPLDGWKVLAFSRPLPLDELHATAHALGVTVTGLLLAAVTGACRAELLPDGCADDLVLHALVPIELQHDAGHMLGNHYGSTLVALPVGIADLRARIRRVSSEARVLRSRMAGVAGASLAAAAGAVAAVVERAGLELYSRKATVVVSSVRGPSTTVHLCGAAVRDVIVWAPASGSIALSVTLMSYAGQVHIGVAADTGVLADAHRVVEELEREIAAMTSFASASTA
jgi:hypothetical protein